MLLPTTRVDVHMRLYSVRNRACSAGLGDFCAGVMNLSSTSLSVALTLRVSEYSVVSAVTSGRQRTLWRSRLYRTLHVFDIDSRAPKLNGLTDSIC